MTAPASSAARILDVTKKLLHLVLFLGSVLGLFRVILTTTQVGATTGVALLEGTGGVNTTVLGKTVFGWIITIVVCAISCSVLFAQGAYAPYVYDTIDLSS